MVWGMVQFHTIGGDQGSTFWSYPVFDPLKTKLHFYHLNEKMIFDREGGSLAAHRLTALGYEMSLSQESQASIYGTLEVS